MKNILINVIKKKNFFLIIKKIFKRFEKNTSVDAKKWAKLNTKQTTENFCRSIDSSLFDEIKSDVETIKIEGKNKLSELNISLGGGGNYLLLYFLVSNPIRIFYHYLYYIYYH